MPAQLDPPHTPSTLDDPRATQAIFAAIDFFKAVDNHPECHPGIASIGGFSIPFGSARRRDNKRLVDATLEIMEADDGLGQLDDNSCPSVHLAARGEVREFVKLAKDMIHGFRWDWMFLPDRQGHVDAIRRQFDRDVVHPIEAAALNLLRWGDTETKAEVEAMAIQAEKLGIAPMAGSPEEARRAYDSLLDSFVKGPAYADKPIEYDSELLEKLGQLNTKLMRRAEDVEAARRALTVEVEEEYRVFEMQMAEGRAQVERDLKQEERADDAGGAGGEAGVVQGEDGYQIAGMTGPPTRPLSWLEHQAPDATTQDEDSNRTLPDVSSPKARINIEPSKCIVTIDGVDYPISDDDAFLAYRRIVDANDKRIPRSQIGPGRIERLMKKHLPAAVRATYNSKSGQNGGYGLLPQFRRPSSIVPNSP